MLCCVKIYLKDISFKESLIFYCYCVLKLHFQHIIFTKIQYNELLSLIIGFLQLQEQEFVDIMMLYSVKIYLEDISSIESLIFYCYCVLKLHFQLIIFTKIQYNEFLSLIIGFLQPYEQKFVDIMMQYCLKIYLEDISSIETLIFYCYCVLKLHFQHIIFAKIQYNEFFSLIIGFLQPYEQKFVNIMMLYSVKTYLEDISSKESLIFYRFPC